MSKSELKSILHDVFHFAVVYDEYVLLGCSYHSILHDVFHLIEDHLHKPGQFKKPM